MKIFDKKFVLIMTVVLGIWAIVSFALPGTFIDNMQGSETYGQKNPFAIYGILAFILICLPTIYAVVQILKFRITATDETINMGGMEIQRLGEEASSPKRSKKEVFSLFAEELKSKLRTAPMAKKILFVALALLWLIYDALCILTVSDTEIATWWLAFATSMPMFFIFRSLPLWGIMLVFGSIVLMIVAVNVIGIDWKFRFVMSWILAWAVMVSVVIRLLLTVGWEISLPAIIFVLLAVGLPVHIIFKAVEKQGRRVPGGFDIAD